MQIILVFPESEEKRRELSRLAAEIHARAVIRRLNLLSCPVSDKLSLRRAAGHSVCIAFSTHLAA